MYWYRWPYVLYIYLTILLGGIIVNLIIPEHLKQWVITSVYPFRHGNLINEIFAYHGNTIWDGLFVLLAYMNVKILTKEWDPLLINNNKNNTKYTYTKIIKSFIIKFILKNLILFILFLFIDRIFIWTGGHCQLDAELNPTGSKYREIVDAELCRSKRGSWIGGFDISGHFCFLINISLILWIELYQLDKWMASTSMDWNQLYRYEKVLKFGHWAIVTVLSIWIFLLITTSIFYHTVPEKILGYILGHISPLIIYYVIPRYIPIL